MYRIETPDPKFAGEYRQFVPATGPATFSTLWEAHAVARRLGLGPFRCVWHEEKEFAGGGRDEFAEGL